MTARKKGVSIGAAMKQRMAGQEDARMDAAAASPTSALVAPTAVIQDVADDPLESFNTRLPRSVLRRLKVHAAVSDVKIQDALKAALEDYLSRHDS